MTFAVGTIINQEHRLPLDPNSPQQRLSDMLARAALERRRRQI